jgi:hypothetical protein
MPARGQDIIGGARKARRARKPLDPEKGCSPFGADDASS